MPHQCGAGCPEEARRYVVAEAAAAANCELVVVQIDLTLPPALMNIVAATRQTKASKRACSIRFCPSSSRQRARIETPISPNQFRIAVCLLSGRPGTWVWLLRPHLCMPPPQAHQ